MAIVVREVWQWNLASEFILIQQCLRHFPYASMDTEFPGTVFNPTHIPKHLLSSIPPSEFYAIMQQNVNALKLVQLGLTLFDGRGNLPSFGTPFRYVWQFNFREFDPDRDLQNPESISLLKKQGIDFLKNRAMGIDSRSFALLYQAFGLCGSLTWVTFHSPYDFGFLIKILTGGKLPSDLEDFMTLVKVYFGMVVYDMKLMGQVCGLYGSLDSIAKTLKLDRVGKSHQAGLDSLLIMRVFVELRKKFFTSEIIIKYNHKLYGLTRVS